MTNCVKSSLKDGTKLKYSFEIRQKWSEARMGEKNPMWKGDKVKYGSLHDWVKWHLPKPSKCSNCQQEKSYLDLYFWLSKYKPEI